MFDVSEVRQLFPALKQSVNGHSLVYFDSAASNLKPRPVVEEISHHYLEGASNVHRGIHKLSNEATIAFESVRERVKGFLNAKASDAYEQSRETIREHISAEYAHEVLFTKGTTEAVNLVASSYAAKRLGPDDQVLLTQMEHHSNIVPWQIQAKEARFEVLAANVDDKGDIDFLDFEKKLTPNVKLVSVVHISNTTGTINDLKRIIDLAHKNGSLVFVDAAQSIAHSEIDVQALDCDFLAFSGHKIFGPTGVGVLYAKKYLLEEMPPYQGGGAMIDKVSFQGTTFADPPHKFEAGTPHIAGVIGLGAAINFVDELGLESIIAYEKKLMDPLLSVLSKVEGLRLVGEPVNRSSIVSFVIEGVHHQDLASVLDNYGIAVRSGHHCTQPLLDFYGLSGTTRISLSVFNTEEDIQRFEEALTKSLSMLR